MKKRFFTLLSFIGLFFAQSALSQTNVFLNSGGGPSGNDGTTWEKAKDFNTYFAQYYGKNTTTTAIPANTNIYIMKGNYSVNTSSAALLINNNILIQGGFH